MEIIRARYLRINDTTYAEIVGKKWFSGWDCKQAINFNMCGPKNGVIMYVKWQMHYKLVLRLCELS